MDIITVSQKTAAPGSTGDSVEIIYYLHAYFSLIYYIHLF